MIPLPKAMTVTSLLPVTEVKAGASADTAVMRGLCVYVVDPTVTDREVGITPVSDNWKVPAGAPS